MPGFARPLAIYIRTVYVVVPLYSSNFIDTRLNWKLSLVASQEFTLGHPFFSLYISNFPLFLCFCLWTTINLLRKQWSKLFFKVTDYKRSVIYASTGTLSLIYHYLFNRDITAINIFFDRINKQNKPKNFYESDCNA